MTVTATQTNGTPVNGMLLRTFVLTGAADGSVQTGATALHAFATGNTEATITTTVTGSRVYGAMVRKNSANWTGVAAGCTQDDDVFDSTSAWYGTIETTSATGTPGATTVGATNSISGSNLAAFAEILPNGTIVKDASS